MKVMWCFEILDAELKICRCNSKSIEKIVRDLTKNDRLPTYTNELARKKSFFNQI